MFPKCYDVFLRCKSFVKLLLFVVLTYPALGQPETQPVTDLDAFYRAVTDGRDEIVRPLLKAHPEWVERELFLGIRPLYRAAVLGRAEVAQLLLAGGARVDDETDRRNQPLHAAAQNGHLAVVQILLSFGAPVDAVNENGETPLHLAARHKRDKVVVELLRNGADPNLVDEDGRTPLHLAAGLGQLYIVQQLVETGANLNAVDKSGYSPLGWSRVTKRNQYAEVGTFLESQGASDIRPQPEKKK